MATRAREKGAAKRGGKSETEQKQESQMEGGNVVQEVHQSTSTESQAGGPEMLKKASPRNIMGKKITKPKDGKPVDLFIVYGTARDTRSGESNYGPWTSLLGTFEIVRLEDGVMFQSAELFLPEPVNGMIISALKAAGDDVKKAVDFAFRIGIKPSEATVGYEYTVKSLRELAPSDALAALRSQIRGALPAPKPATAPEPQTA